MFGTMRTEICKVIGNVIYQSLIIIPWFGSLQFVPCLHKTADAE